jgi:translocator protein
MRLALSRLVPAKSFAAPSAPLGMLNIFPQLILILGTAAIFYRLDEVAAWCLAPLAAWVEAG